MKKRIIWSNMNINPDDWKEGYKEIAEENGLKIVYIIDFIFIDI